MEYPHTDYLSLEYPHPEYPTPETPSPETPFPETPSPETDHNNEASLDMSNSVPDLGKAFHAESAYPGVSKPQINKPHLDTPHNILGQARLKGNAEGLRVEREVKLNHPTRDLHSAPLVDIAPEQIIASQVGISSVEKGTGESSFTKALSRSEREVHCGDGNCQQSGSQRDYTNATRQEVFRNSRPKHWLIVAEVVCVMLLTAEILARFIVSYEKCRFFTRPLNIIDVIGTLPSWILIALIYTHYDGNDVSDHTYNR